MSNEQPVARGLGYLSLGLGLSQLLAPSWFARTIGVRASSDSTTVVRLVGLRELLAGAGLLTSRNPAPWVWLRVGGDLIDLALLGRATTAIDAEQDRLNGALAGTVAVTAMDIMSGLGVSAGNQSASGTNGHGNGNGHANGNGHSAGATSTLAELPGRIRETVMGGKPVRKSITIGSSPSQLYAFWRRLENLPQFMRHLQDVRELDD